MQMNFFISFNFFQIARPRCDYKILYPQLLLIDTQKVKAIVERIKIRTNKYTQNNFTALITVKYNKQSIPSEMSSSTYLSLCDLDLESFSLLAMLDSWFSRNLSDLRGRSLLILGPLDEVPAGESDLLLQYNGDTYITIQYMKIILYTGFLVKSLELVF